MRMMFLRFACVLLLGVCACVGKVSIAQRATTLEEHRHSAKDLVWNADDADHRFVAVHGRRALVMGYPRPGLEIWAYPLQLVSGYQVIFIPRPGTYALNGVSLLRHVEYRSDEIIRTYVGSDF